MAYKKFNNNEEDSLRSIDSGYYDIRLSEAGILLSALLQQQLSVTVCSITPALDTEYCIPAAHAEVAGNPPKLLEEGESKQQDEGTDSEPLLGIRRIHGMAGQFQVLNSIPEELESDPDAECIHQS